MKNNNKFFLIIILFIICTVMLLNLVFNSFSTMPVGIEANAYVGAKAMTVMEVESKKVLLKKNYKQKLAMASTTKIMTALVTLENVEDLEAEAKIDPKAVGIEGTSIYLRKNESMTVKDLLLGLMLASGNDASVALASYVGKGNIEAFIEKMNQKAKELGANDTIFSNPHGLDDKNHYTTAYDLALITSYAMQNPKFREIVGTRKIQIKSTPEGANRFLVNKQRLLRTYEGATGVKTGFTDNAGRCSVSSAIKDGMEIVCVVLNAPNMFEDSKVCLNKAFNMYKKVELLKPYSFAGSIKVSDATNQKVKVYTQKGFSYPLKIGEEKDIVIKKDLPTEINTPIKKEQPVGKIEIYLNKDLLFSENIYTIESVEQMDVNNKVKELIKKWFYD